jgi:hypothetical protein
MRRAAKSGASPNVSRVNVEEAIKREANSIEFASRFFYSRERGRHGPQVFTSMGI